MATVDRQKNRVLEIKEHQRLVDTGLLGSPCAPRRVAFADLKAKLANPPKTDSESYFGEECHPTQYEVDTSWIHSLRAYQEETPLTPRASPWIEPFVPLEFPDETHPLLRSPPPEVICSPKLPFGRPALGSQMDLTLGQPPLNDAFSDLPSWARVRNSSNPSSRQPSRSLSREEICIAPQFLDSDAVRPINDGAKPLDPVLVGRGLSSNNEKAHNEKQVLKVDTPRSTKKHVHGADFRRKIPTFRQSLKSGKGSNSSGGSTSRDIPHCKHSQPPPKKLPNPKTLKSREAPVLGDNGQDCQLVTVSHSSEDLSQAIYNKTNLNPDPELSHFSIDNLHEEFTLFNNHAFRPWHETQERQNYTDTAHVLHHVHGVPKPGQKHCSLARGGLYPNNSIYNQTTLRRQELIQECQEHLQVHDQSLSEWRVPITNSLPQDGCLQESYSAPCQKNDCYGVQADPEKTFSPCEADSSGYYQFDSSKREIEDRVSPSPRSHVGRGVKSKKFDYKTFLEASSPDNLVDKTKRWSSSPFHLGDKIGRRPRDWTYPSEDDLSCYDKEVGIEDPECSYSSWPSSTELLLDPNIPVKFKSKRESRQIYNQSVSILPNELQRNCSSGSISKSTSLGSLEAGKNIQDPLLSTKAEREQAKSQSLVRQDGPDPDILRSRILLASYNKVQSEASNSKSGHNLKRYCRSPFVNVLTPLELDSLASSKSSKPSAPEHQFTDALPNDGLFDDAKVSASHNQRENAILEFCLGGISKELQDKSNNRSHRKISPSQTLCPSKDSHNASEPMSKLSRNIEDSPFWQSPESVVFENDGSVSSTSIQASSTPRSYFHKRPTPLHVSSRKRMKRKPLSESYEIQGEEVQRRHRSKYTFSQAAGHLVDLGLCEKRITTPSRKRYSDPGQHDDDLRLSRDSEKTLQSLVSHHLNSNSRLTPILPAPSPSICSMTSVSSHEEDGTVEKISKKRAKDHPHIPSVLDSRASSRMSTLPTGRMSEEEPLQNSCRTPEYECQNENQNKLRVTLKGPKFPKSIAESRICETPSRASIRFQVQEDQRDNEEEIQRPRRLVFKKHAGSTTKCKNRGVASFRKGLIDQKITDNLENISPPMDLGNPSPSSRKSPHKVRTPKDNKKNVTTQLAPKNYASGKCTESRIQGKETPNLTSRKSKNTSFSKEQDSQSLYRDTGKSSRNTGRTTLMREHQAPTKVKGTLFTQTVPQCRRKSENKLDPGRHVKAMSEEPKAYKGEITLMEQHSQFSINHLDNRQQKSPPKKAQLVKPRLPTPPRSYLQNFLLRSDVIEEQEDVKQHLQGVHGASKWYKETPLEASRPVFPSASTTGYKLKSTSDCHCFHTETKLEPRNKLQSHPSTGTPVPENLFTCTSTPFPQSGLGRSPKFSSNMSSLRTLSERNQTCCIHDDSTEGFESPQRLFPPAIKTSDKADILGRTANFTSQVPVPVLQTGEEEAREQKISKETVVSKECGITTSEGFLVALHKERLHRATSVTNSEPSDPILELNRQYQALREFIDIIFQSLDSTPKAHSLPPLRELKVKQVNLISETDLKGRAVTLIDMPGTKLEVQNNSLRLEAEKKKSIVELKPCPESTKMALDSPSRVKIKASRSKPLAKRPRIHPGSEHLPEKLTADTEKICTERNALPGSVMLGSVSGGTNATPLESHPKRVKSWPERNKGKKQKLASSVGKRAYSIRPSSKEPKSPRKARLDQSIPKGFTTITPILPPTSEENHTKPPWCKFYKVTPKNGVVSCLFSDARNEKQGTLQSFNCSTSLRLRQPNLEITQFDDPDTRLKMPIIGSLTKTASPQRQLEPFKTNSLPNSLKLSSKLSPCLLQRGPLLDSGLSEILRTQKAYWKMALLGSRKLKSGTTMQAVDASTSDESSTVTTVQLVPDYDQKVNLSILEEAIRLNYVYKAHPSSTRAKNLTPSSSNNVVQVQEQGNKMAQDLEQRNVEMAQDAEQGNSTVQDLEQAEVDHIGTSNKTIKAAESHNLTSQIFLNIQFSSPKQHTETSAADNATENSLNTKSLLIFHSSPPDLRYHDSANQLQSRSGSGRQLNNDYRYDGQTKPSSESFTLADDSSSHIIQVLSECAEDGEQTRAILYPCEYSATRKNSQSDRFHNARSGTLAVKNSSTANDSVPYLSSGHASVNTNFLPPNSVKIRERCSSDIRARTSPLDRLYSWMPSSSPIIVTNPSKISRIAADNHLPYDHNWRTPGYTCDSDVKSVKSATSDHDEERSAYNLPLANAFERSWRTTGTSTTDSQQTEQSGYVYHGGLKPSYHCSTPAAGKPSHTTNWPNLLPVCRTCSTCKDYSISNIHTACNQTSLPCSITWNGDPNMPLMASASSTLQHIQATRPDSIPSEHSMMSSGSVVTSMSINEGSRSLEKPGFMPVKTDCSTPTMNSAGVVSTVHRSRPTAHVVRMEDFGESQTPTRSEASCYVNETRRKQLGEVVLDFSPRAGDLMIVRRRRHQQLKDNGYVSFYTRDHDSYPWNTGDFVLSIGKFVNGNSWQMSSTVSLFQKTHDRLWMSVGLLEKPDRMLPWVKRNMVVDKHCRFFVPRRGDLIVKLQALESPSQLERWSFRTRLNIGDILVRAFIGDLGFEEPKEEVEGHAEIYVYGGKDSSWTFMGRDDCLYKDGFDLLERGLQSF